MKHPAGRKRDENGFWPTDKIVLSLLLQGKGRTEICEILSMPRGTLNSCCTRLYRRFGVHTIVELLVKVRDEGGAMTNPGRFHVNGDESG